MKDFNLIEYIYTKEDNEINQTRIKQKKSTNLNRKKSKKSKKSKKNKIEEIH